MSRSDIAMIVFAFLLLEDKAIAQEVPPQAVPSLDDRDYLLRKQQEIFRLSVETDYALALQKLCQTGYGDPHLCHLSTPNPPINPIKLDHDPHSVPLPPRLDLPVVQEISGLGAALSATLKYDDGLIVTGREGALLRGGDRVIAVEPRRVLLKRAGGTLASLSLAGDLSADPVRVSPGSLP